MTSKHKKNRLKSKAMVRKAKQARRNNKQALEYFKTELEYWQSDAARHNNAIPIVNHNVAKLQLQIRELDDATA